MRDDVTGEPLIQRNDDTAAVLVNRLKSYHQTTKPVAEYYKRKGIWHGVDAAASTDVVFRSLAAIFSGDKK